MCDAAEEFVSEQLRPVAGTADTGGMSRGEPGLPGRFRWRGEEYAVVGMLRKWKTSGPCHHGSPEIYLRRHWYEIRTEPPLIMKVYCRRQAPSAKLCKARWWVYSVRPNK